MHLYYPLAGEGRRMQQAGYPDLKPFIRMGGKRLIEWALLPTTGWHASRHYYVSLPFVEHPASAGILPPGCFHVMLEPKPGEILTSLLQSPGCFEHLEDVLICDGDSTMEAQELTGALEVFRASGAAGGVTVRRTQDPGCSYVQIDGQWWVDEAREKDPFTSWSSTGPYWFRTGYAFLQAAQKAKAAHHQSIAPVYNYLDGRTKAVPVESFRHLGTPEALALYFPEEAIRCEPSV